MSRWAANGLGCASRFAAPSGIEFAAPMPASSAATVRCPAACDPMCVQSPPPLDPNSRTSSSGALASKGWQPDGPEKVSAPPVRSCTRSTESTFTSRLNLGSTRLGKATERRTRSTPSPWENAAPRDATEDRRRSYSSLTERDVQTTADLRRRASWMLEERVPNPQARSLMVDSLSQPYTLLPSFSNREGGVAWSTTTYFDEDSQVHNTSNMSSCLAQSSAYLPYCDRLHSVDISTPQGMHVG